MSAEKEIVNYWCNEKGLFTVNNIKAPGNRDCGILALKFEKDKIDEIIHVEVSCSITSTIGESNNIEKSVSKIISDKFENKSVMEALSNYTKQLPASSKLKRIMVLGAIPKTRKNDIIKSFMENNVEIIEFEDILYEVLEKLGTQYHKNDIIRTMQLIKFLLLSEPEKMAKMLVNDNFTTGSRKEFLMSILDKDEIVKEFKKTNVERLGAIMKNANLKPEELAKMIGHDLLNSRTRKSFLSSLNEQEKIRKVVGRIIKKRKTEASLEKFF